MIALLRWAPCGADSPTWTPCDPRRGYDAGTFKQGRAVNAPSHPRIASPDVAADCSFTQNDCSSNLTDSTILFSLTRAAGDARGGVYEAA